jgi:hypothetical protein
VDPVPVPVPLPVPVLVPVPVVPVPFDPVLPVDPVLLLEVLERPLPHPASRLKKKIVKSDVERTMNLRTAGPMDHLRKTAHSSNSFALAEYSDGNTIANVVRCFSCPKKLAILE